MTIHIPCPAVDRSQRVCPSEHLIVKVEVMVIESNKEHTLTVYNSRASANTFPYRSLCFFCPAPSSGHHPASCSLRFFPYALCSLSSVLRYACAPTATRSYLTTVCVLFLFLFLPFFCFSVEMSLFPGNFVPLPFYLCMESTSYVFSFRVGFFTSVYTRIQSNQSINQGGKRPSTSVVSR